MQNRDYKSELQELHLRDYIDILILRRKTFFVVFISIFLSVVIYTLLSKPVYEASSTIYLEEEQHRGLLEELDLFPPSVSIDAEIEIVKSRTIAEEVIRDLHLNWKIFDKSDGMHFKINQFSSAIEDTKFNIVLTDSQSYEVKDSRGNIIGKGSNGVPLISPDLSLLISEITGSKGDRFTIELIPLSIAVASISNRVDVKEIKKRTNVMKISCLDTEPKRARDVVNALVKAYINKRVAFKTEEATKTISFIKKQLINIKKDLDHSEELLERYKSSHGLVELSAKADSLIQLISDAEMKRAEIIIEKKQIQFTIAKLEETISEDTVYIPTVMRNNPALEELASILAKLEVQKSALVAEYTVNHPLVRNIRKQIYDIHHKILAIYGEGIMNLEKEESSLSRLIGNYEEEIKLLPSVEVELAKLMRDTKVNADIYTFMRQKNEEARIAEASTISNINVIDPAISPDRPVKPKTSLNLILALFIGLMAGIFLAFFQEYLDDTIKDPESAKRELGLPLLVVIPYIEKIEAERDEDTSKIILPITYREPSSAISEVFRSLRTNIHFSSLSKKQQILLITSSFPGEGKTTIFANFAVTLSQINKKVMIIDCDLRRSFLHEIFGHSKKPGITDILAGDIDIATSIHDTGIVGVDLITAGTVPPNPAELLGSQRMNEILDELRKSYDYILLDAPPLLAVTDAHLLAGMSDMVIVVLEAGRVPIRIAQRMRELLNTIGTPLAGVIVNDKTSVGTDLYGYREKYYSYGYYGTHYTRDLSGTKPLWKRWLKR